MSSKYPGGIISKTAPTPSGNYADSTAPGVWTLEQQAYWQKLGQWPTAGNVNPNAFIENLFSTYLYTGTGSVNTITNGLNLSGNGGLVWTKGRNTARNNTLVDTVRGGNSAMYSNTTDAAFSWTGIGYSAYTFGSTGYTNSGSPVDSENTYKFASWTFRKQPKFFDIVTWTGNGAATQTISHNLGSAPGCIIAKSTSAVDSWWVYHRAASATPLQSYLRLNLTNAVGNAGVDVWGATSTTITVDANLNQTTNGVTYVAYLFAHDAGGFGLSGSENVISCGSFTAGTGSINLGYEPQWIMFKGLTGSNEWIMFDTMRGWPTEAPNKLLMAQSSAAEGDTYVNCQPTATGFNYSFSPSCIYIAIRKGPMAVPTLGTSVYNSVAGAAGGITTGFVTDSGFVGQGAGTDKYYWSTRLTGGEYLNSISTTSADPSLASVITWDRMNGFWNNNLTSYQGWGFKRAPGFHDIVCYTGTGSATTQTHNLAAVPELMIFKRRNTSAAWGVYCNRYNGGVNANQYYQILNQPDAESSGSGLLNNTNPTSSLFTVGTWNENNASGSTYVAYLFATVAGVSKVGSYTGTGAAQTINCGFTTGSRFVMIKRTDSTGDWYLWDSSRGIIPANDPYLLLNSNAAQVTGTDYVDTTSVGFDITSTAPAAINANGGTFIFLAIA